MSEVWYSTLVDSEERAHAQKVVQKIRDEIQKKGFVSFAKFMDIALYAPGLGYYCVGTEKIGAGGDFVTAPEISPLFAQCLASYSQKVLAPFSNKTILELGAGTGRLALGILEELARLDALPDQYWILDLSPELQQRQKNLFQKKAPHFLDRIQWLNELPGESFDGVIIANEVLDAMPVNLFQQTEKGFEERVIEFRDDEFVWGLRPVSSELGQGLQDLNINFPVNYYSEINLNVAPWMGSLSHVLNQGKIILIDYGFLRPEYYHPQRVTGTLMCHFKQRAHSDPLILTGIQDITAHVDFTAVGNAAENLGLKVSHYSTQAQFLLDNNLLKFMQEAATNPEQHRALANQVKMLTLPTEMGELFKVMILEKKASGIPLAI